MQFRPIRNPLDDQSEWDRGWRYGVVVASALVLPLPILAHVWLALLLLERL
jgi:hypothetical protein